MEGPELQAFDPTPALILSSGLAVVRDQGIPLLLTEGGQMN